MKDKIVALVLILAAALLPSPGAAQQLEAREIILVAHYDLDSASFIYCRTLGRSNRPDDAHRVGLVNLATSGSTTTVTGTNAFANIAVGDILLINDDGVTEQRVVEARASASSITVNSALNITAAQFMWRKLQCGTADTSGAFPIDDWHSTTINIILAQENSGSTDYQVECRLRGPAQAWSIVNGPINDLTTFNDIFATDLGFAECRVGARVNTDDGVDTGVNAERLTILVKARR